jgi:hypothetical protein
MGPLLFRCPVTASIINSQIETNEESVANARSDALRVFCPHCKDWHELPMSAAVIDDRAA